MPKLLSINNYHYRRGGADIVFLEHNRLFSQIGWNVVPFCMHHPKNIDTPWSKYFVTEVELGQPYSILQKVLRVSKAVYSFEARSNLRKLLKKVRPDVVHCHNIYHHISPSILQFFKNHDIPTVITLHDLKLACPAYTMLAPDGICERCKKGVHNVLLHKCMKGSPLLSGVVMVESTLHRLLGSYSKNVDKFVVPSLFYREKFVDWGWERERFAHIPNFVDLDAFTADFSPGKYFLYFGRLSPEKGIATLIKASALAKVHLCIAGTGPQEVELRRLVEKTGANVSFLGYITGAKLQSALQQSRATVLPSEWYENAPLSVMESYACGKPVIGAAIGGIPELIKEGETGVSFRSGSVENLAEVLALFQKMADQNIASMGLAGRVWMESEYTTEKYRYRLLELYEKLGSKS